MTAEILMNRFVRVTDDAGEAFYVQGMQDALRPRIGDANDSRASCTCARGFERAWCVHKTRAAEALRGRVDA